MDRKRLRTREHGQSLVEYALIVVLVAVVAIVVIGLAGLAVQRVFGVAAGALGAKHNTTGVIDISPPGAQCVLGAPNPPDYPNGFTGILIEGTTSENVQDLTYSSNLSVGTGAGGGTIIIESNGSNGFSIHHVLVMSRDRAYCPSSVVIQGKNGAIAVSPVTVVEW